MTVSSNDMSWFSKYGGRLVRLAGLAALGLLLSGSLWAQCQMCKKTASFQNAEAVEALNRGIILLAIPPAAIVGGIFWITYRHRDGYQLPASNSDSTSGGEPPPIS
jgi:hypothetical protein